MGIIDEPTITREEVLVLVDDDFNSGNVCIVTGAAGGIGRATAVASAANNIMTVGLDINEEEGKKTEQMARDMGGKMVFLCTDLTRDEDIESAVAEAAKLGQIRYVANIAGIQHIDPIEKFPIEKFDTMQKMMLRAPYYLSELTMPYMKKSPSGCGVIGNMSSVHGHICTMNKPAYNMTKFGLRALSQSISLRGEGKIRSFTVSTAYVKTNLVLKQVPAQAEQRGIAPEDVVKDVMKGKAMVKEMMSPIEVGNLFVFGFSRFARYLVGGDLLFDGGFMLTI